MFARLISPSYWCWFGPAPAHLNPDDIQLRLLYSYYLEIRAEPEFSLDISSSEEGAFASDLTCRINPWTLNLPPVKLICNFGLSATSAYILGDDIIEYHKFCKRWEDGRIISVFRRDKSQLLVYSCIYTCRYRDADGIIKTMQESLKVFSVSDKTKYENGRINFTKFDYKQDSYIRTKERAYHHNDWTGLLSEIDEKKALERKILAQNDDKYLCTVEEIWNHFTEFELFIIPLLKDHQYSTNKKFYCPQWKVFTNKISSATEPRSCSG